MRVICLTLLAFLPASLPTQQAPADSAVRLEITSTSEEAIELFWMALSETQNYQETMSAQHLASALELDPTFGLARVAHACMATGLNAEWSKSDARRGLSDLAMASGNEQLVGLAWYQRRCRRDWAFAKQLFAVAVERMPGEPFLAYQLAMAAPMTAWEQKRDALERVADRFPDFSPTYNYLAIYNLRTGRNERAEAAAQTYVTLEPDLPNAHDTYAQVLQWLGRYEEAADHARRAIELGAPPAWHDRLANILQLSGRGGEARAVLEAALEIADPDDRPDLLFALGNSFLLDGVEERAVETFQQTALEAERLDRPVYVAAAYEQAAITDGLLGDGRAIEGHLAAAAAVRGLEHPRHIRASGLAYGFAGETEWSRREAGRLAERGQEAWAASAHLLEGLSYLRDGAYDEAESELRLADPARPLTAALLAECYLGMNRLGDGRDMLDQALSFTRLDLKENTGDELGLAYARLLRPQFNSGTE